MRVCLRILGERSEAEDVLQKVYLTVWRIEAKGDKAQVTIRNVMHSNGVIHVVDTVLLPG